MISNSHSEFSTDTKLAYDEEGKAVDVRICQVKKRMRHVFKVINFTIERIIKKKHKKHGRYHRANIELCSVRTDIEKNIHWIWKLYQVKRRGKDSFNRATTGPLEKG